MKKFIYSMLIFSFAQVIHAQSLKKIIAQNVKLSPSSKFEKKAALPDLLKNKQFNPINKPDSATAFDFFGNDFKRYYYTYNTTGLISQVLVKDNFNGYADAERYTFNYHSSGKLSFALYELFDVVTATWEPIERYTARFAPNNDRQFYTGETYFNGQWEINESDSVAITLDANNRTVSAIYLSYNFNNNSYVPSILIDSVTYSTNNHPNRFVATIIDTFATQVLIFSNMQFRFGFSSIVEALFGEIDKIQLNDIAIYESEIYVENVFGAPTQFDLAFIFSGISTPVQRRRSTISNNRVTEITNEAANGSSWQFEDRNLITYSLNGQVASVISQLRDGNRWINDFREIFTTDAQNLLQSKIAHFWDNGAWEDAGEERYLRQFSGTRMINCAYYDVFAGNANLVDSVVYHYATVGFLPLNDFRISVFPNPASDFLSINFNGKQEGIDLINIFNIKGQLVKSIELPKQQQFQGNNYQLVLTDLENGFYLIQFQSKTRQIKQTMKFLKQ